MSFLSMLGVLSIRTMTHQSKDTQADLQLDLQDCRSDPVINGGSSEWSFARAHAPSQVSIVGAGIVNLTPDGIDHHSIPALARSRLVVLIRLEHLVLQLSSVRRLCLVVLRSTGLLSGRRGEFDPVHIVGRTPLVVSLRYLCSDTG
jgi:hypothetical protein